MGNQMLLDAANDEDNHRSRQLRESIEQWKIDLGHFENHLQQVDGARPSVTDALFRRIRKAMFQGQAGIFRSPSVRAREEGRLDLLVGIRESLKIHAIRGDVDKTWFEEELVHWFLLTADGKTYDADHFLTGAAIPLLGDEMEWVGPEIVEWLKAKKQWVETHEQTGWPADMLLDDAPPVMAERLRSALAISREKRDEVGAKLLGDLKAIWLDHQKHVEGRIDLVTKRSRSRQAGLARLRESAAPVNPESTWTTTVFQCAILLNSPSSPPPEVLRMR
jgi:hypothetical protein